MKYLLSLLLALTLSAGLSAPAAAESPEDALAAAAGMSNEELYARACDEMAAGARLNFYSTTSFAEKAADNFMAAYPELKGRVRYADIADGETYSTLTNEIGFGLADSADMALVQNGPDLKVNLLDYGLSLNYFPDALKRDVPEKYQNPTVVTFINSLMIYNNREGSVGVSNVWQLTEPKWKAGFSSGIPSPRR